MALFGVQAHFLNDNYQLQIVLLSLPKLHNEHTGAHLAELAFKITEKYGFTHQLSFTVADNANNNDTMVQEMERQFNNNGYKWDATYRRL